jgi:hypothetical protein
MQPEKNGHEHITELLQQNQRLLAENNQLLKQLKRNATVTLWFRIIWFFIIIGLPFVLYYFIIEPYFEAMGSSFEVFRTGLQEIPGWKQFYDAVRGEGVTGE